MTLLFIHILHINYIYIDSMGRNGNLFASQTQSVRRRFPLWLWLLCIATIL